MPTYSLKCTSCNEKWTDFLSISDMEKAVCPKCGAKAETDYGAKNSSLLIKGKGFYQENKIR